MIICLCAAVTDRDLDKVIEDGASTVEEVGRRCGAGTGCGSCLAELRERLGGDADPGASACASTRPAGCGSALVSVRSRQIA